MSIYRYGIYEIYSNNIVEAIDITKLYTEAAWAELDEKRQYAIITYVADKICGAGGCRHCGWRAI